MTDIVITEFMDHEAVASLQQDFHVVYQTDLADHPSTIPDYAARARALIVRNRTRVTAELLDQCPELRCIGRLGVGLDNIDLDACKARAIEVLPASGANDDAVAEYVITGALMLLRGAYHATERVAAGEWPRQELSGQEIRGKVLGLIGFGAIARSTARRAGALGMQVIGYDPFVAADDPDWGDLAGRRDTLDAVLQESDALSLHVPLTAATHHMIDAAALQSMKPGAVVINAARGGIVDERALVEALRTEHIGGAILDVFEEEPLPAHSPLADVPRLILTPHIAGVTRESNVRVSAVTADNVRRVLEATL